VSVVANVAINVDSSGAVSKLRQVQQGAQATSQAVDKLNATTAATGNKFRGAGSSASALAASLGKLAAAYFTLQTAQRAVQAGIQREESGRRLTFLAQGYNEVAQAQQAAARAGKQFGLSTTESNQQFAQLYGRLRPLNTSLTDIEAAFIGFNTAAKVSGTSAAESAGALLQLTQALGSGVLRGQELNSVLEQAPGLVVALTQELGTPISQIRKLAEEGKITSDVVIRALKRAGTEGASQLAEAMKGPAQQVKNLQNAFQDFQVAITRDVLPAFIGIIKGATELFRLFGQLPGPMKTIIAAAIGLTAAFVALAPAISTAIGLLGGLSLATLAAAGPWIALAAGITAAVVALASYRSESEKIGAKAAAGDPAALATARNRIASKQQEVSLLERQRPGPRSSRGGDLANARRELAQLKRDVAIGTTAPATVRPNAMGTSIGATVGGGGGAAKGKTDAERAAEKAAREAERAAEAAAQEAARVKDVIRNRLAEGQIIAVKTQQQDRIAAAEAAGDKMLVARLQSQERELEIQYRYAQELAKEVNLDAQKAIIYEGQNALTANQLDLQRELDALQSQSDQDRLTSLQKAIEKQYELNTAVQNQLQLADGVANTLGQGLGSAFDALINGAQGWEKSLQQIASGVLVDIANQLIRIFVIEQAINAIKAFLTPFSASTPLGAGGGQVGKFGTLGPNFGIPQRAKGGPVSSGQTYMVGERGPELFVPGRSGTIVANDKMGGGSTNVVVNVDAKGSSVEGNDQGANQLGRVISAAVQSELIKQQRPGGILAR
jgi:tape measure domain-containing protein